MTHNMKLRLKPFDAIASGQKVFELRLYDEKRKAISAGDIIKFTCLDEDRTPLFTRVIALHLFPNFSEMYATLPLLRCGYTKEEVDSASPEDMNQYYSAEEQKQYGVVGIELSLLTLSPEQMERTSRFLSLVLRHKPEAIGIRLDNHGWANVDELLAGLRQRRPLTMAQLEDIVQTDAKRRYSFNEDRTKIRANQGHSIPVDVELQTCTPPEILYHGTGEKYVDSILEQGLLHRSRLYVHLSGDVETAKKVGTRHGRPRVFSVHSGQMHRNGYNFFLSENGIWLTEAVPPKYLELLEL